MRFEEEQNLHSLSGAHKRVSLRNTLSGVGTDSWWLRKPSKELLIWIGFANSPSPTYVKVKEWEKESFIA